MPGDDVTADLDLREYGRVLRRRKGVVISALLIVTAAAMAATFVGSPVYEARAQVLLQPRNAASIFDSGSRGAGDPNRLAKTEIQVVKSRPVSLAVKKELNTSEELDLSVEPVEGSDIIEIKSRSTDATRAATVANAFTRTYIELRRSQADDELLAAGEQLQGKISELQKQIEELQSQPRPSAAQSGAGGVTSQSGPVLQTLVNQQALLKQRLDELQVEAGLRTGGAQLVASAAAPSSPVEPKPVRNAILALIGGLVLGVGLAFVVDHFDDAVRTRDDLVAVGKDLPVLGLVPVVSPSGKGRGNQPLLAQSELNSPAGEAYRALRTSLQLLSLDRAVRTVLVTSPLGSEGKTTTTANLGVALARAGEKVVLVDCDLRRPQLHNLFGLDNAVGLTSVLVGDAALESALQSVPGEANLRLLASGPMPPLPPELLSSKRTADMLDSLRGEGRVVLLDSPPLLPVTDAVVLARRADAILLVVNSGSSTKRQVHRAIELLAQTNPFFLGTVLNRIAMQPGDSYAYAYQPDPAPILQEGGNGASGRGRWSRRQKHTSTRAYGRGRWSRRQKHTSTRATVPTSIDDPALGNGAGGDRRSSESAGTQRGESGPEER